MFRVSMLHTVIQRLMMVIALLFSVQIFIFENNIYYKSTIESRTIRLVSTGQDGVVFNGLADWLYEGKTAAHHYSKMKRRPENYSTMPFII